MEMHTLSFEGRTLTTPYKCGVAHVWKIGDTYFGAKGNALKLTKHDTGSASAREVGSWHLTEKGLTIIV